MVGNATLVVSWFGGHLAMAVEAPEGCWVTEVWEPPVISPEELNTAFTALLQRRKFSAKCVIWLVDHPQLFHVTQEFPQTDAQTLRQLMEHSLKPMGWKMKTHSIGYWSCKAKNLQRIDYVITVLPKEWRNCIQQITRRQRLAIVGIYSPASVIHEQYLKGVGIDEQGSLEALEVGSSLYLIYGVSKVGVQLVRSIPQFAKDTAKVSTEIERTLLFLQQKLGVQVGTLYLAGKHINALAKELQISQKMEIMPSGFTTDSEAYNALAASMSMDHPANWVSQALLKTYRWGRRLSWGTALFLFFTLWAALVGLSYLRELHTLEAQKAKLENKYATAQMSSIKVWEKAYGGVQHLLLVENFLERLSEAIPSGVRLTGLHLEAKKDHWSATLQGQQELILPEGAWLQFRNQLSQNPLVVQLDEALPKEVGDFTFSMNLK